MEAPLNDKFIEFDGVAGALRIPNAIGFAGITQKVTVDFTPLQLPGSGTFQIFGKRVTAGFLLRFSTLGAVTFISRHGGSPFTAATVAGTLDLDIGKRCIVHGVAQWDDIVAGYTQAVYINGSRGTTMNNQDKVAIDTDANDFYVATDNNGGSSVYVPMRFHGLQVEVDDVVICRIVPRQIEVNALGQKYLRDYSGHNNHGILVGTEGTNYFLGSVWSEEPVFAGLESL